MKRFVVATLVTTVATFGAYMTLLIATWNDPRTKDGYYE